MGVATTTTATTIICCYKNVKNPKQFTQKHISPFNGFKIQPANWQTR